MEVDVHELKALRALRRAVAAAPDDVALRLRLVSRLLEMELPQDAWHHCLRILKDDPGHFQALRLACKAAAAAGAPGRAEEYVAKLGALMDELPGGRRFNIRGVPLRLIRGGREDSGTYPALPADS